MVSWHAHKLLLHLVGSNYHRLIISVYFIQPNPVKIRQKHFAMCNMYQSICWDQNRADILEGNNGNKCFCTLLLPLNKRINKRINNGIPVSLDVIMLLRLSLWCWHSHSQRQNNTTGALERIGFAVKQTDNNKSRIETDEMCEWQKECNSHGLRLRVPEWGVGLHAEWTKGITSD